MDGTFFLPLRLGAGEWDSFGWSGPPRVSAWGAWGSSTHQRGTVMRMRIGLLLVALFVLAGNVDPSEACWHRRARRCYCPCPAVVTVAPPSPQRPARVRTFLEGAVADDDRENVRVRPPKEARARTLLPSNTVIPAEDIFEGSHRATPKTTVVHGGESETFEDIDGLIGYFESPTRRQEQWWGTVITKTTEERNQEIELVNVTINNAWIYEISKQADNDYHLLIGVNPDADNGRYLNAEISGINPDSPDATNLWELRKSFKKQYQDSTGNSLPTGFTQPMKPIHIRVSGSIFLDADHGRRAVGHGDIKNFTSWEIHPITNIQILGD